MSCQDKPGGFLPRSHTQPKSLMQRKLFVSVQEKQGFFVASFRKKIVRQCLSVVPQKSPADQTTFSNKKIGERFQQRRFATAMRTDDLQNRKTIDFRDQILPARTGIELKGQYAGEPKTGFKGIERHGLSAELRYIVHVDTCDA